MVNRTLFGLWEDGGKRKWTRKVFTEKAKLYFHGDPTGHCFYSAPHYNLILFSFGLPLCLVPEKMDEDRKENGGID